ncbi:uncharacterized protein VTP21DRAFT_11450 [Calcarisporiella thermophila]|uniref:uncharacterized protein n=1 Tax=Calcarisporiella thermophila TaxID=911321 RepID=UPI003743F61A
MMHRIGALALLSSFFIFLPTSLAQSSQPSPLPPCVVFLENGVETPSIWSLGQTSQTGEFSAYRVSPPFNSKSVPWEKIGSIPVRSPANAVCVAGNDGRIYIFGGEFAYSVNQDALSCRSAPQSSTVMSPTAVSLSTTITSSALDSTTSSSTTSVSSTVTPYSDVSTQRASSVNPTPSSTDSGEEGEGGESSDEDDESEDYEDEERRMRLKLRRRSLVSKTQSGKARFKRARSIRMHNHRLMKRQESQPSGESQSQDTGYLYYYDTQKKALCQSPPVQGSAVSELHYTTNITATWTSDDKIIIFGGSSNSKVFVLDPKSWTLNVQNNTPQGPETISPLSSVGIFGQKAYIFGAGKYYPSPPPNTLTIYSYDIKSSTWESQIKQVGTNTFSTSVGAKIGDKMYIVDVGGSGAVAIYDPATGGLNTIPAATSDTGGAGSAMAQTLNVAPPAGALTRARAVSVRNSLVLFNIPADSNQLSEQAYSYDTTRQEWIVSVGDSDTSSQVKNSPNNSNGSGNAGNSASQKQNAESGINLAAIIGGSVGGVALIALIIGLFLLFNRRKNNSLTVRKENDRASDTISARALQRESNGTAVQEKFSIPPSPQLIPFGHAQFSEHPRSHQTASLQLEEVPLNNYNNQGRRLSGAGSTRPSFASENAPMLTPTRGSFSRDAYSMTRSPVTSSSISFATAAMGGFVASTLELETRYLQRRQTRLTFEEAKESHPHAPENTVILGEYVLEKGPPIRLSNGALLRHAHHTSGRTVSLEFYAVEMAFNREVSFRKYLQSPYVMEMVDAVELAHGAAVLPYVIVSEPTMYRMDQVPHLTHDEMMYFRLVAKGLAQMLSFFHGKGIVHLALETAAFLSEDSDVTTWKVTSFQHARFVGEPTDKVCNGYSAPEALFDAENESVASPRMDMWSLGCILYEIWTREPLFADGEEASAMLAGEWNRVRDGGDGQEPGFAGWSVPRVEEDEVATILNGLLQVDPGRRWDSGRVLRELAGGANWD